MNVSRQPISKWELGDTSADLSQANKIFQVSLDDLTENDIHNIWLQKLVIRKSWQVHKDEPMCDVKEYIISHGGTCGT